MKPPPPPRLLPPPALNTTVPLLYGPFERRVLYVMSIWFAVGFGFLVAAVVRAC